MRPTVAVIAVFLILASNAAAGHRRCEDPSDVNYGYNPWYSAFVYQAAPRRVVVYEGYGFAPVFQPRALHRGQHYGFHSSPAGHYGTHSGVHVSPDEGLHSGYHYGYDQGAHYGEHSGVHADVDARFGGWVFSR